MSPRLSEGSYAYANTRVRAMRGKLVEPDMYPKLLKMSEAEIIRYLEDNEYKKEIDEMAPRYQGINLIEYALSRNMARHFRKILDFSYRKTRAKSWRQSSSTSSPAPGRSRREGSRRGR